MLGKSMFSNSQNNCACNWNSRRERSWVHTSVWCRSEFR